MEIQTKTEEWLDVPDLVEEKSRFNSIGFVWLLVTAITANILFGGVSTGALGLLSVMLALGVVFWVAESLFTKRMRYSKSLLLVPFLGLILLGIVQLLPLGGQAISAELLNVPSSTALSIDPYATTLAILKLILFVVFFAGALIYLDSPKRLRTTVFVLIIFGGLMSFLGILQKLSNPDLVLWIKQVDYAQPFATYVNQHHFAAFLCMTAALTLGLLFSGSTRPDRRLLLIIAVVLMGLGIVFTTSRGALISLITILAFLTFLNFKFGSETRSVDTAQALRSKALILVGGNIALLVFLFVSVAWIGGSDLVLRQTGISGPSDVSNGRLEFWSKSFEIIRDNPLVGTGLDTFGLAYTKYDEWNGTIQVGHAHNDYLEVLSDGGIVGFGLVVAFLFLLFKQGLKTISTAENPYRRGIAAGALAACLGILVHSLFDFPLRTNANMFFFLICAALATVPVKFPAVLKRKRKKKPKKPSS